MGELMARPRLNSWIKGKHKADRGNGENERREKAEKGRGEKKREERGLL